jgi:arsenate reductase
MAEAILRYVDPIRFESLSAGARPAGYVHPLVHEVLRDMHVPIVDQHSKSWNDFIGQPLDLLVTVCSAAAGEVCPVWPPPVPPVSHWPLPDPVTQFDMGDPLAGGRRVAERLMLKIRRMVALDWENCDAEALQPQLDQIADL